MQQIPVTLYCAGFFCAVLYIPFREAVLLENYLQISSSAGSCYGQRHFPLCYFNSIVTALLSSLFCLLSDNVIFNGYNNYMNFFIYLLWPMKEKRQQRRRRQRAVYSHVRRVPGSCCEKNNHFYKKKRGGRRKQGTNRDLLPWLMPESPKNY